MERPVIDKKTTKEKLKAIEINTISYSILEFLLIYNKYIGLLIIDKNHVNVFGEDVKSLDFKTLPFDEDEYNEMLSKGATVEYFEDHNHNKLMQLVKNKKDIKYLILNDNKLVKIYYELLQTRHLHKYTEEAKRLKKRQNSYHLLYDGYYVYLGSATYQTVLYMYRKIKELQKIKDLPSELNIDNDLVFFNVDCALLGKDGCKTSYKISYDECTKNDGESRLRDHIVQRTTDAITKFLRIESLQKSIDVKFNFREIVPEKREIKHNSKYGKVNFITDERKQEIGNNSQDIVNFYLKLKYGEKYVIDVSSDSSVGYDTHIINDNNEIIMRIEIKTEGFNNSFIMTNNEINKSYLYDNYYIYIVDSAKTIKSIKAENILNSLTNEPLDYRFYF